MSSPGAGSLPSLSVGDFGPGKDHVAEALHNGKVMAILHRSDPARPVLPHLQFAASDGYTYVFVHGGRDVTRFENLEIGTFEIPEDVMAKLLTNQYGSRLTGMSIRM